VALIDDEQRKLAAKLVKVAGDRLHAAETTLPWLSLRLQAGGKDIRLQAKRAIFGVVLRHQLFNVRQHQHATARQPRKSAITRLLPAPVGSTIAAGSVWRRNQARVASTASCW
jgi:hypothetical protein